MSKESKKNGTVLACLDGLIIIFFWIFASVAKVAFWGCIVTLILFLLSKGPALWPGLSSEASHGVGNHGLLQ